MLVLVLVLLGDDCEGVPQRLARDVHAEGRVAADARTLRRAALRRRLYVAPHGLGNSHLVVV